MVELAALHLRPATFDPVGTLQTAAQLQGAQTQTELARLNMTRLQEEMAENRERRGAQASFRTAGGLDNPAALSALSGHPEAYATALSAVNARDTHIRLTNAREAQDVMGYPEGSPQRQQAYTQALARALEQNRISPEQHAHYSRQPPTNLFLRNIIAQATAPSANMTEQERLNLVFRPDSAAGGGNAATSPFNRPGVRAFDLETAPGPAGVMVTPATPVRPPGMMRLGGPGPVAAPASPVQPAQATGGLPVAMPYAQTIGTPPAQAPGTQAAPRTLRDIVNNATPAQQGAIRLMLTKNPPDYEGVAKLLQEIEGKPPDNYERDPNNPGGYRAIAGSAATQLSGDIAGRMAALETAMGRLPHIRTAFERSWGAGDHFAFQMSGDQSGQHEIPALSGDIGNARRELRLFGEALLRVMTGAAATPAEMDRVNALIQIGPSDSVASARHKLDMLQEFAQRFRGAALAGRTANPGALAVTPPSTTQPRATNRGGNDPMGIR